MGSTAKRTWVIEESWDPETGERHGHYDREQALACMEEVEHLLYMVGGMVAFTADRVQVGELGGEPLAVSRGLVVTWSSYSPMRRDEAESEPEIVGQTEDGHDIVRGEVDPRLAATPLEDAASDEDEDEADRTLTTAGAPRPDADLT